MWLRGDTHPNTKLSAVSVAEMKSLFKAGVSVADLAQKYGYTKSGIRKILKGINWKYEGLKP